MDKEEVLEYAAVSDKTSGIVLEEVRASAEGFTGKRVEWAQTWVEFEKSFLTNQYNGKIKLDGKLIPKSEAPTLITEQLDAGVLMGKGWRTVYKKNGELRQDWLPGDYKTARSIVGKGLDVGIDMTTVSTAASIIGHPKYLATQKKQINLEYLRPRIDKIFFAIKEMESLEEKSKTSDYIADLLEKI